jgi:hypothetical protein
MGQRGRTRGLVRSRGGRTLRPTPTPTPTTAAFRAAPVRGRHRPIRTAGRQTEVRQPNRSQANGSSKSATVASSRVCARRVADGGVLRHFGGVGNPAVSATRAGRRLRASGGAICGRPRLTAYAAARLLPDRLGLPGTSNYFVSPGRPGSSEKRRAHCGNQSPAADVPDLPTPLFSERRRREVVGPRG